MSTILIVPGLRGSGPDHWQSWFETRLPGTRRVIQDNWETPCIETWAARVGEAIDASPDKVWIIAHSFGCLASVTAAFHRPGRLRGALLVAPADPQRFDYPDALFERPLGAPGRVVASTNDPWVDARRAAAWAGVWGCDYQSIGAAGHINVDSGHGPWPQGLQLFEQLRNTRPD